MGLVVLDILGLEHTESPNPVSAVWGKKKIIKKNTASLKLMILESKI